MDDANKTSGPLAGVLVIDLTRVLAGPYATMVLADLGARVVKVEAPGGGDDSRGFGPFAGEGDSAYFTSVNRGKQSIALDLKAAADRAIFDALLVRADVLAENFRPGAMARLGYGWDALHARFPRLILASTSGFGQTGPDATRPAYDVIVQAMGGLMSVTGPDGGEPVRVGTSIGDITAGLFTVVGIMAALSERDRTGAGAHVDVAMLDCQIAILENAVARYQVTGTSPGPIGTRHPTITPFQAFATADRPIVLAAGNDALWRALCAGLERPDLAEDARFASNAARTEHVNELKEAVEARLRTAGAEHWLAVLDAAGVPAGPLNDVAAALANPQVAARQMLVETATPGGRPLWVAGNPVKLSGHADNGRRTPAPKLDGDRAAILADLGLVP